MITLALAQMIFFVALQAKFTGGEDGIQSVPRGRLFGVIDLAQPMAMYSLVTVVFLAGFLLIWRVVHSPFGQVLKAIRENETAPSRSATTPTATSSSPSSSPAASPAWPARPRRSFSSSHR